MRDKQPKRKSLTDILRGGGNGADWINNDWGGIPPAPDFGTPVPKGPYITHIIDGALFNAKTGTPGYKVTHEIIEGDHRGRRLWHDVWLSGAAKRGAVRDLAKLGIHSKEQLEQPIPTRRIRCKVFVVRPPGLRVCPVRNESVSPRMSRGHSKGRPETGSRQMGADGHGARRQAP